MADYREMMDKMRREGVAEQRARFNSTAGSTGLPSREETRASSLPTQEVNPVWYEGPKPRGYAQVTERGEWELPLNPGTYRGSGGYEYELREDGSLKILKSPRSGGGQEIIPGGFIHDLVMNDIKREKRLDESTGAADEAMLASNLSRTSRTLDEDYEKMRAKQQARQREREIEGLDFKPMAAAIEFESGGSGGMIAKK